MAYPYRGPQSPRDESQFGMYSNPLSPQRNPNRLSGGMMPTNEVRGGLTRRFTTNALPTLSPAGQQRKQAAGDYAPAAYSRKVQTESQAQEYEKLLAIQRKLQSQMERIDPETRREVDENLRHEASITQMMASASEPASPPEYNNAFPNAFSRPQRYSAASLTSPPGITNRVHRSSIQLTSPPVSVMRPSTSGFGNNLPSQSVPGSRRQSDDEEDHEVSFGYESAMHRAAANPHRNSMPITGYGRKRNVADSTSVLGPVNITSFLFDDDEDHASAGQSKPNPASPPDSKTSLHLQHTADGFPKLIRRDENGDLPSSALDLAFAQGVEPQQQLADHATASRHRASLPPTGLGANLAIAPLNSILANADSKSAANNRRSTEVKFTAETKRPALMASPPHAMANGIQTPSSSYSTNDIPTLKSINSGDFAGAVSIASPSNQPSQPVEPASQEQNATLMNRVPSATPNNFSRQSQDLASFLKRDNTGEVFNQVQLGLQGDAAPFGPINTGPENHVHGFGQSTMPPYAQSGMYNNSYNMQMLNNGFNNLNMGNGYGGQGQWPGQMPPTFQQPGGYSSFQQYPQANAIAGAGRYTGDQAKMTTQQRRQANEEAQARFKAIHVKDIVGEIYNLCKDQNGCRFLQRKLDEGDEESVQVIFDEVKGHIIELMTDPFGNYLCQKLLESTTNEQRTVLVQHAMPAMTKIALNQHGTRALQKMIEFITTPQQTQMIIEAMRYDVVQLIQDLNGNHVIQKCLNHLTPDDALFIFEAVGANCVTVGTHRHGCCVLQRCIDHADGLQKGALVDQVIANAFALVQDPFGNYVVQYILDLSEPCFTEPLCRSFYGNVVFLSKQKFSSNVIEKCIRCATEETQRTLIREMISPPELERLLRDSFANYVVQTAMDFGDEGTKALLIESVRPMLPSIRNTPYGRRIQSKISDYDARNSGMSSGVMTPVDPTTSPSGTLPYGAHTAPSGRGNRSGWIGPSPQYSGNAGFRGFGNGSFGGNASGNGIDIASPTPQRYGQTSSMFPNKPSFHGNNFGDPGYSEISRQGPHYGHF